MKQRSAVVLRPDPRLSSVPRSLNTMVLKLYKTIANRSMGGAPYFKGGGR